MPAGKLCKEKRHFTNKIFKIQLKLSAIEYNKIGYKVIKNLNKMPTVKEEKYNMIK